MHSPRLTPSDYTVKRLAERLLADSEISEPQLSEILTTATSFEQRLIKKKAAGTSGLGRGLPSVTPAEIIAAMRLLTPEGFVLDEDRVTRSVAKLADLSHMKIDPLKLDHSLVTETMTRVFARRHACLPISKQKKQITFAIDNPFDQELLHDLEQLVPGRVKFVVASRRDILRFITEIYGFRHSVQAAEKYISAGADLGNLEQLVRLKNVDELEADDAHIVNAVEYLLHYSYNQRASDIHMEPKRNRSRMRLRIDGILHDIFQVPIVVHKAMVSRLKTLARMDIAERRRPQDGRIKTAIGDVETELRVSTVPVAFGEKLVMRIFDPGQLFNDIDNLGFEDNQFDIFQNLLAHRSGMILVTGPTGSGKTTSLYSTLNHLASPEVNIVTVEDPVEMIYESFNQVQVQRKINIDFPTALRSILRQDPDIIMIGEIRDSETALMAAQAALTGHLVFSTLHTNDSASAVTRLMDLGVPPFLISSTLLGVLAQRLTRLVCTSCATSASLSPAQAAALEIEIPVGSETQLPVQQGMGCPRCRDTGLRGRTGVYEVMPISPAIRELIRSGGDAREISKVARTDGMISLREAAIRKLAIGLTSFNEVVRVVGEA